MVPPFDLEAPERIFLDKDGRWFHEGVEITHPLTLELFSRSVRRGPDGGYWLQIGPERARIEVEDTPYMVREATWRDGEVELKLNDGSLERLDPSTLWIGKGNVLYCLVKPEKLPARFLRPAYYQLVSRVEQDEIGYFLSLRGKKFYLRDQTETAGPPSATS